MEEVARSTKNINISIAMSATHEKRKQQTCRIFTVKIQENKLSEKQREQLKMIFVEAKWLVNAAIRWAESEENKIWNFDAKTKTVIKKDKDFNDVEVKLKYIGSQQKQSVIAEMLSNIKSLASLKKSGKKIGKIKYRKEVKSLDLKQYGNTYKILLNGRMKLQNISGKVHVNGLKQFVDIPGIEFANAKILNTPLGYYVAITTFQDTSKIQKKETNGKILGIDFGCTTSFVTSEGEKIACSVQENDRLKRLQRKFARQKTKSKRREKVKGLIKSQYQKLSNRKNDLANKIVAKFNCYETIVIQDEQLSNWQKSGHGKAVQHSVLGRVKSKLMKNPKTVVLSKTVPTTKLCTNCGIIHDEIKVWDRIFNCICGVSMDRDVHAAQNMIWLYENNVGVGRTKFKRMETEALVNSALSRKNQLLSLKCEGATL